MVKFGTKRWSAWWNTAHHQELGSQVRVSYDNIHGFPMFVSIDYENQICYGELYVQISDILDIRNLS